MTIFLSMPGRSLKLCRSLSLETALSWLKRKVEITHTHTCKYSYYCTFSDLPLASKNPSRAVRCTTSSVNLLSECDPLEYATGDLHRWWKHLHIPKPADSPPTPPPLSQKTQFKASPFLDRQPKLKERSAGLAVSFALALTSSRRRHGGLNTSQRSADLHTTATGFQRAPWS